MIVLVLGLVGLSHAPFFRIETVTVGGTELVSPEKVKSLAAKELEGSYGYLFARDNVFIYPQNSIANHVLESNPIIKNVEVEAEDLHTVTISIVERTSKALWCPSNFGPPASCFFMDEDGVIYEQAPEFSSPIYVAYAGKAEEKKLPKQFLSVETFRALSALVDAIAQTQSPERIERVVVDENNDVYAQFVNGFVLRFALQDDGGDVYERFTLALESDPFKDKKLPDFEYLDLRFGDKLYYKLRL